MVDDHRHDLEINPDTGAVTQIARTDGRAPVCVIGALVDLLT